MSDDQGNPASSTDSRQQQHADFLKIDTDDDQYITAAELKAALGSNPRISDENIAVIVKMADSNADKRIDFEEHVRLTR